MGYQDDIFDYVSPPNENPQYWRVTNCAHILPGYKVKHKNKMGIGDHFSKTFTPHPGEGFVVQFNAVPWAIMKRYWRKPIHLNRKFHSKYGRRGYACGAASIEVLEFDIHLLRDWKCFFADFSFLWVNRTRTSDVKVALWMLQNVRGFSILTDADTPFNRPDDEVIFALEHL